VRPPPVAVHFARGGPRHHCTTAHPTPSSSKLLCASFVFFHSTNLHCFCTSTALPLHFSSCLSASDFLSSLPRSGFRHLPFRSMFTLLVLALLLALCFQPASATSPSLGFVDPAAIMSSPYPDPGSMLFGNICQECGIALYYCAHAPASLLLPNTLSY
jgi:hypothetical protein